MHFKVGDVLLLRTQGENPPRFVPGEEPWVVLESKPYTASAHNDSWSDRTYVLGRLEESSGDRLHFAGETRDVSTHDCFERDLEPSWWLAVSKRVEYELVPSIVKLPGRHRA